MISIIRSCCSSVILLSLDKQSPRRKISAPTSSKGPEMDSDTLPVLIIIGEGNPSQQRWVSLPHHCAYGSQGTAVQSFLRAWPREHLPLPSDVPHDASRLAVSIPQIRRIRTFHPSAHTCHARRELSLCDRAASILSEPAPAVQKNSFILLRGDSSKAAVRHTGPQHPYPDTFLQFHCTAGRHPFRWYLHHSKW